MESISLGELQIKFRAQESEEQTSPETVSEVITPLADKSDQAEPQKLELSAMDENVLKEQYFAQQLIDDPTGFEGEICDGFLERARGDYEETGT